MVELGVKEHRRNMIKEECSRNKGWVRPAGAVQELMYNGYIGETILIMLLLTLPGGIATRKT